MCYLNSFNALLMAMNSELFDRINAKYSGNMALPGFIFFKFWRGGFGLDLHLLDPAQIFFLLHAIRGPKS